MTKKEMITACVDDQVKRGIIKEEEKEIIIKMQMKSRGWSSCERWYNDVFNK